MYTSHIQIYTYVCLDMGFPWGSVVKNPPANAGDGGSIPGSGEFPGEKLATHSSVLAWEIPQTEELGSLGLQSLGSQKSDKTQRLNNDNKTYTHTTACDPGLDPFALKDIIETDGVSLVAQMVKKLPTMRETWL